MIVTYHEELLELAFQLCHFYANHPTQASLRRAVSTAYYALFHLLISESVDNWRESGLRNTLGRAFDHQQMRVASNRTSDLKISPFTGEDPLTVSRLRFVARTFADLQQQRHAADYDNAIIWDVPDALRQVEWAQKAFAAWRSIRTEKIAQAYLVSLLVKSR